MIGKNTTIGFVGTGVMGKSMALNLMKAGYSMMVYTRTKSKAGEIIGQGAQWKETAFQLAREADVVITMVGYPKDVEELYLGEEGIINSGKEGTYLIDMTTSSPNLAKRIYREAAKKGMKSLDAPVSGGDIGAREGRLSIMVGGDAEDFQSVKPLFQAMGSNILLQGGPGSGQYTKMCNQITIACNMIGICEALAYGTKAGLDPRQMLKSIETGAAASWGLSNLVPRILDGNFAPGFYVKHFIKDMNIALESSKEMGLMTPGLDLAKSLYDQLARMGEEDSGTQALCKLYL